MTAQLDGGPAPVVTSLVDGVLTIRINRPQARNAVDMATASALAAAMDELDGRSDVRVGVLAGSATIFSAGMDLKAFLRGEPKPRVGDRGFAGFVERPPRKLLIAAVEGPALAGGFEMALACDLIVAATDASFGLPEVKRGLVAAGGGLLRLPRRIPAALALELAVTGDSLTAQRAYEVGLVNRLAAPGEATAAAWDLATTIAANGPLAVEATKTIMAAGRSWPEDQAFALMRAISDPVFESSDAREGARAFAEKRSPRWAGR